MRSRLCGLKLTNYKKTISSIYGTERSHMNAKVADIVVHKLCQSKELVSMTSKPENTSPQYISMT